MRPDLLLALELGDGSKIESMVSSGKLDLDELLYTHQQLSTNEHRCDCRDILQGCLCGIRRFFDKVLLGKLLQIFRTISDSTLSICADNSFHWEGVEQSAEAKALCLELIEILATREDRQRLNLLARMLENNLITRLDAETILRQETCLQTLPSSEKLLVLMASSGGNKNLLLLAVRKFHSSAYPSQDRAAVAIMENLNLTYQEAAELMRDMLDPYGDFTVSGAKRLNSLPTSEKVTALKIAGTRFLSYIELPKQAVEQLSFLQACKKVCSADVVTAIRAKL